MTGPTSKRRRQRAHKFGHWAEWIAAAMLAAKAYRILAIRYRTRVGELDLIARKRDLIVFVEVKARASALEAVNAVDGPSRRRIHNAADVWLGRQKGSETLSLRFDIVAVCPWRLPVHFQDAF